MKLSMRKQSARAGATLRHIALQVLATVRTTLTVRREQHYWDHVWAQVQTKDPVPWIHWTSYLRSRQRLVPVRNGLFDPGRLYRRAIAMWVEPLPVAQRALFDLHIAERQKVITDMLTEPLERTGVPYLTIADRTAERMALARLLNEAEGHLRTAGGAYGWGHAPTDGG
jgi:hypothetical protein